ncbi:hypothetical protein, partial [Klebsiella pneumoniae]|uniref:hypothetical protein n=1 Tax=Klebsiella pneumoniae TaxID=573 RepID=UPI0013D32AFC
ADAEPERDDDERIDRQVGDREVEIHLAPSDTAFARPCKSLSDLGGPQSTARRIGPCAFALFRRHGLHCIVIERLGQARQHF